MITKREAHPLSSPHILPVKLFHDSLYVRPVSLLMGMLLTHCDPVDQSSTTQCGLQSRTGLLSAKTGIQKLRKCVQKFLEVFGRDIFYLNLIIISRGLFMYFFVKK